MLIDFLLIPAVFILPITVWREVPFKVLQFVMVSWVVADVPVVSMGQCPAVMKNQNKLYMVWNIFKLHDNVQMKCNKMF